MLLAERAPDAEAPQIARAARHAPGMPGRLAAIVVASVLLAAAGEDLRTQTIAHVSAAQGVLSATASALAFTCLLLAALPLHLPHPSLRLPRWWDAVRRSLRPVLLALALGMSIYSAVLFGATIQQRYLAPLSHYNPTDVTWFIYINAELVLAGHNPYTSDNVFWTSIQAFPQVLGTPMRRGAFGTGYEYPHPRLEQSVELRQITDPAARQGEFDPRTLHSYPALSFLLYLPFAWSGPKWMLLPNVIVYLALLVWLVARAPRALRAWVLLAALTDASILIYSLSFDTEVMCAAALLAAWHWRSHRWLSPLLVGLGCAFKQYVWFFAPFFLVARWRTEGWRAATRDAVVMLGAFLLPNLPFIVASPHAWLTSMFLPMSDPMFPMGMGLIALSIGHVLPWLPPHLYTVLEMLALALALVAYARWQTLLGPAMLVLALVPLYFAFRSSPNYFAFAPWLALYGAIEYYRARDGVVHPGAPGSGRLARLVGRLRGEYGMRAAPAPARA